MRPGCCWCCCRCCCRHRPTRGPPGCHAAAAWCASTSHDGGPGWQTQAEAHHQTQSAVQDHACTSKVEFTHFRLAPLPHATCGVIDASCSIELLKQSHWHELSRLSDTEPRAVPVRCPKVQLPGLYHVSDATVEGACEAQNGDVAEDIHVLHITPSLQVQMHAAAGCSSLQEQQQDHNHTRQSVAVLHLRLQWHCC